MEKLEPKRYWRSYRELAEKDLPVILVTGIKQSTLTSWRIRNTFPRLDDAYKIACALNTSVDFMLTGKNPNEDGLSPFLHEIQTMVCHLSSNELDKLISLIRYLIQLNNEKGDGNIMNAIDRLM